MLINTCKCFMLLFFFFLLLPSLRLFPSPSSPRQKAAALPLRGPLVFFFSPLPFPLQQNGRVVLTGVRLRRSALSAGVSLHSPLREAEGGVVETRKPVLPSEKNCLLIRRAD